MGTRFFDFLILMLVFEKWQIDPVLTLRVKIQVVRGKGLKVFEKHVSIS